MKSLPMQTKSYRDLFLTLMGSVKARLMMTALNLGIFDELGEFQLAEDVAGRLATHSENTRRFLDALAMIDLVEKKNGRYRNRPQAETFLVSGAPCDLGSLFRMIDRMEIDSANRLKELLIRGPDIDQLQTDMTSEALWAEGARASAGHALGNVGVRISRIVSGLPGFRSFQRMLDLGGGHGVFALYIVNAHPGMKGTVFDRPAVVKVAESFIQEYGMADRVGVKAGDYLMDDIGEGYDLIWASATLNFAKLQMDALLQKVHDALNPGGYFLSFQDGMTHEQTRPDTMLGHMMDMLRTGVDFLLDQGFVADAMLKAGFSSVRSRTLETPMGCMDLDIARKKPA